jgi:glycosyltransferase involved in cell wall biosynthesis
MKIAWVTVGRMADPADGRVYPAEVIESGGRLTSNLASARLRMLVPKAALEARGHDVELWQLESGAFDRCVARLGELDAIVFKKTLERGQPIVDLFDRALAAGVPTLFDICDPRFDPGAETGRRNGKMLRAADRVITSTPALAEVLRTMGGRDIRVITDPYEGPRGEPAWRPSPDRLKVLWFGHPSNLDTTDRLVEELGTIGRERPIQLTLITGAAPDLLKRCKELNQRWRHALALRYEEWSPGVLWAALAATDLVVIPSLADSPAKIVKSPNRMVEGLWAGRCVVANPLPAYLPFAPWAFVDDTIRGGLQRALAEQDRIVDRVRAAQAYIADAHSPERIGEEWELAIAGTVEAKRRARPAVGAAATQAPSPAPAPAPAPLRLNLGCGDKILPGYVNVDVAESRAGKRPDVLCDLHRLTPFADASADEVLSVHVVEHFWRWEVLDVLREWMRVLKPGGRMILECPNLLSACEAFLADPERASSPGAEGQRTMWVFYGDPAWKDPLMVHRWGYTPKSLARLMQEAGLVNVRQEPAQFKLREPRDMRIVGEKRG